MGYAEMKECWLDVKRASVGALSEILPDHAEVLGLAGAPGPIGTGAGEPHVLITCCSDGDAIVALTLLPAAAITPELAAALAAIDGRVFAGSADLDPATWDEAVKVLALLAFEHRTVEQLAQYARDEGSSLSVDDLRPFWNLAAGHAVSAWSQLAVPITHAYSLRRAHCAPPRVRAMATARLTRTRRRMAPARASSRTASRRRRRA
jgi:hypothetical protein